MAGPWEKYQKPADGPWAKYGAQAAPVASQPAQRGHSNVPEFDPGIPGYNPETGMVERQAQPSSTLSDVAASGASGLARGAADLVGLPGTINNALTSGMDALVGRGYRLATGREPEPGSFWAGNVSDYNLPVSGSSIRSGLSTVTGGATDYQPQTTAGEYARTIGEFAPGAAALGGTSLPALGRNLLAPALSSETAGQMTEGSSAEPYARIVGALLGGAVGSKVGSGSAPKLPTAEEIKKSANYSQIDDVMRKTPVEPSDYRRIVGDVWKEAQDFGLTTDLKGRFGGTLRDFLQRAETSGGASMHDIELLRRSLRNASGNTLDNASQTLSAKLVDRLDDSVSAMPASGAIKEARQIYRTGMKAQLVEDAMQRAQTSASGVENGLRNEFRKLIQNPKLARNFSKGELAQLSTVSKGTAAGNAMRWLGTFGVPLDQGRNFLGSLSGGGVGATIGGALGGPVGATIGGFALPAVGTAAKAGAARSTSNLANIAEALIKSGPEGQASFSAIQQANRTALTQTIARALMQGYQANQTRSKELR